MILTVRRLAAVAVLFATSAHALDLDLMWNFRHPAVSEERFRAALKSASGDDALILQTQIARTYMLRGDFDTARGLLAATQASAQAAGPEARARYWLETGRSYASHRHPPGTRRLQPGNVLARRTCGPSRSPQARTLTQWLSMSCTCFLSSRRILRNNSTGTGRPWRWWRCRSRSRRENGNR